MSPRPQSTSASPTKAAARLPALRFKRLRTKLMVSYLGLFFIVLMLIVGAVYVSVADNTERVVRDELNASAVVFDRVWQLRAAQLGDSSDLLSEDFGFKAAIASKDMPTINSALANLRRRLGVDLAFLVGAGFAVAGAILAAVLISSRDSHQHSKPARNSKAEAAAAGADAPAVPVTAG